MHEGSCRRRMLYYLHNILNEHAVHEPTSKKEEFLYSAWFFLVCYLRTSNWVLVCFYGSVPQKEKNGSLKRSLCCLSKLVQSFSGDRLLSLWRSWLNLLLSLISAALGFYVTNTTVTIIFLRIATIWPKLCLYIAKTEKADPLFDNALVRKCNVSCVMILFFAACKFFL